MQPVDEDRFHDVIADYLRQIDRGEQVDRGEILARHPEFAEPLRRYFEGVDVVEEMAGPRVAAIAPASVAAAVSKAGNDFDNPLQEATLLRSIESTGGSLAGSHAGDPIPESFGRYKILKALGQGAMGAVYLAHDTQLDREVALKIPKFGGAEAHDLLERFYREARSAAALRHPNICPVFDVGEINGQHYITMAFIKGRPLKEFTRAKKRQPERQVAAVIRKLALGLAEAHAHGVIHRDLKPANIMVDTKGEPVVMDFGLARRTAAGEAQVTHSGMIVGTPAYMSPEQVEGDQKKIGPAADIYALGVIFYELLTGQLPFQGGLMSILKQIAVDQPPVPSQLRAGLDPQLEAICLQMMAKNQAERYGSMNEVSQALTAYLKTPVRPAAETAPVATAVTAPQSTRTASPKLARDTTAAPVAPAQPARQTRHASLWLQMREQSRRVPPRVWLLTAAALLAVSVLYGAATLYFRLGKVDVKVVIDDPRLTLTIDGETVTFAGSEEPIRLSPGERAFVVEGRGLKAETDSFTVSRDGKNVLRVSVVEGEIQITKGTPLRKPAESVATTGSAASLQASVIFQDSFETPDVGDQDIAGWGHFIESRHDRDATIVPNWVLKFPKGPGFGSGGIQDPGNEKYAGAGRNPGTSSIPGGDGHQVAFIAGQLKQNVSLTTVSPIAKVVRGTQYELSAAVGFSRDVKPGDKTWIELLADEAVVAVTAIPPADLEQGRLKPFAASFSAVGDSHMGQELRVRLRTSADNSYIQMNFDNVRVTASPLRKSTAQESGWQGWPADAPPPAIAPFDAAQATQHQEAWAKYLQVPVEYRNSIGMQFRLIPPGEFLMGSTDAEINATLEAVADDKIWQECAKSEAPQHKVILTHPFYLGTHEVTQAEYEMVMGINPAHFSALGKGKETVTGITTTNFPVEMVSWNDAAQFCSKLSEMEDRQASYLYAGDTINEVEGNGYRMPTEAEWEFACRAGTSTRYWTGDQYENVLSAAWIGTNSGQRPHTVGELKSNPFGLFDIHGNVWEFTQDGWEANYYSQFQAMPALNPRCSFSVGSRRVIHGGNWFHRASQSRSSLRLAVFPSFRDIGIGFRVVLPVDVVQQHRTNTLALLAKVKWTPAPWTEAALGEWQKSAQPNESATLSNGTLRLVGVNNHVLQIPGALGRDVAFRCRVKPVSGKGALFARWNENGHYAVYYHGPGHVQHAFGVGVGQGAGAAPPSAPNTHWTNQAVYHPPQPLGDWFNWTFVCRDRFVEVFVDDVLVMRVDDHSQIASGALGLATEGEALFEKVEYAILDNANTTSSRPPWQATSEFQKWMDGVAKLPAEQQIDAVVKKLQELNPGYDGQVVIQEISAAGSVILLKLHTDQLSDISPVASLREIRDLCLEGSAPGKGKLTDLSPLRGLRLRALWCNCNPRLSDLSPIQSIPLVSLGCNFTSVRDLAPLRGMRLTAFLCIGTPVADLAPLRGMPLEHLEAYWSQIADLSPLAGCPLRDLRVHETPVHDLSPLKGMTTLQWLGITGSKVTDLTPIQDCPLRSFEGGVVSARNTEILRSIKTLETIGTKPAAEFWKEADAQQAEFQKWMDDVAKLSAKEQVAAVTQKLRILNPGRDAEVTPVITDEHVTRLTISGGDVTDLSPVRALTRLRHLGCVGGPLADLSPLKGLDLIDLNCQYTRVSDLSPLKGMQLQSLCCWHSRVSELSPLAGMPLQSLLLDGTQVTHLSPLKGMPLSDLRLAGVPVSDLSPLQGMPLTNLICDGTKVSDLSPLTGMKLTAFACGSTPVADLSPLKGMPLKTLWCPFNPTRDVEILRSIKTLETINGKPAAEFWKSVDSPPPTADPDRAAAEHWLAKGGNVLLKSGNVVTWIGPGQTLPDRPFQINRAGLTYAQNRGDYQPADLRPFAGAKLLTALGLEFNSSLENGDEWCAAISELKNLTDVVLVSKSPITITEPGLSQLSSLPNLKTLRLKSNALQDRDLQILAAHPQLNNLQLITPQITAAGLTHLQRSPKLSALTLSEMILDQTCLEQISKLAGLTYLNLSGESADDAGLKQLAQLSSLSECHLTNTRMTGSGFAAWPDASVVILRLAGSPIDDAGLQALAHANFSRLAMLELHGSKITDAGIVHLKRLPALTTLNLRSTKVTDRAVDQLTALKQLKSLSLEGTKLTPAGVARLKAALPQCQIQWDNPAKPAPGKGVGVF